MLRGLNKLLYDGLGCIDGIQFVGRFGIFSLLLPKATAVEGLEGLQSVPVVVMWIRHALRWLI